MRGYPRHPEETPAAIQDVGNLTEEERAARMRALRSAAHDEGRRQIREAEERQQRNADEAKRKVEEEEAQRKAKEEEEARKAAAAQAAAETEAVAAPPPKEATGRAKRAEAAPRRTTEAPAAPPRRTGKPEADRPTPRTRNEPRRRDRKLTISQALDEADGTEEERVRSLAAVKRAREREKQRAKEERASGEVRKIVREVVIPETISVADLANRMAVRGIDVVKALMRLDIMANVNHVLDAETAELIVSEFGHNAKLVSESDVEIGISGEDDAAKIWWRDRRWSRLWAMSITARPRYWMRCGQAMSRPARRAASRSISVHIKSN